MTHVVGAEVGSPAPKPSATTPAAGKPVAAALKAVVLAVAEERVRLAREAGLPIAAEEADLATAKALDPATFAVVVTKAPQVTLFKPVAVTVGNPHLETLVAKAKARLAKPDGVWRRATATSSAFNDSAGVTTRSGSHAARSELRGDFGVRSTAIRLREDLWLFGNPASPLFGNPELLTRLLRRPHAFADAYALHEQQGLSSMHALGLRAGAGLHLQRQTQPSDEVAMVTVRRTALLGRMIAHRRTLLFSGDGHHRAVEIEIPWPLGHHRQQGLQQQKGRHRPATPGPGSRPDDQPPLPPHDDALPGFECCTVGAAGALTETQKRACRSH